jgi:alpha-N-arabinofuranosidase
MADPPKPHPLAPATADGTFDNPILPGMHPDPSICRVGPDFFLATSSFEYFPGVPIFHSRDLVHWRAIGHALTRQTQLDLRGVPSSGGIYAPTLRHHAGRFYLVTTLVGSPTRGGNFYVTADDPRGPWSEPIWLDAEGFDPSLLFAGGDVYYLRDGKGSDPDHPHVYQARIDPGTGALLEPLRVIWKGTGGIWPEGAHVYEMKGRYYLFAAEGGTSYGHSEVVARAASAEGPFEPFPGNPILGHGRRREHRVQALGHADLVELDDGSSWAVFLGIRPTNGNHHHLGRETFLAPVRWRDDGWPVIGNDGQVDLSMRAPGLAPQPFPPEPARDDFDGAPLGPAWISVRNPDPQDLSLDARPGFLRLIGSQVGLDDAGSPALVARRQQHFRARCRAALEFSPGGPNEEAGLTVRAREGFHYDLSLRGSASGREAVLASRIAGTPAVVARAPLGPGAVTLEVATDETWYRFAVIEGQRTMALGQLPATALSAEEIGKHGRHHFTGAVIGLYASGNGRRATAPADFDWFEYLPLERIS